MFLDRKPFLSWRAPLTVPIYILPFRVREKIFNEHKRGFIILIFVTRCKFIFFFFYYYSLELKFSSKRKIKNVSSNSNLSHYLFHFNEPN